MITSWNRAILRSVEIYLQMHVLVFRPNEAGKFEAYTVNGNSLGAFDQAPDDDELRLAWRRIAYPTHGVKRLSETPPEVALTSTQPSTSLPAVAPLARPSVSLPQARRPASNPSTPADFAPTGQFADAMRRAMTAPRKR